MTTKMQFLNDLIGAIRVAQILIQVKTILMHKISSTLSRMFSRMITKSHLRNWSLDIRNRRKRARSWNRSWNLRPQGMLSRSQKMRAITSLWNQSKHQFWALHKLLKFLSLHLLQWLSCRSTPPSLNLLLWKFNQKTIKSSWNIRKQEQVPWPSLKVKFSQQENLLLCSSHQQHNIQLGLRARIGMSVLKKKALGRSRGWINSVLQISSNPFESRTLFRMN